MAMTSKAQDRVPPSIYLHEIIKMMPQFRADTLQTFVQIARQYGDIIRFKGLYTAYEVHRPEEIEHVLQHNQQNYRKGRNYKEMKSTMGEGLIVSEGETWRRQRRMAQPFFNRQQIASFAQVITDSAREMLARWQPYAENGTPFDVNSEMLRLTLGIVGQTLFSIDLSREADALHHAFITVSKHKMRRLMSVIRLPESWPTPGNRKFHAAMRTADRIIYGLIAERRRAKGQSNDLMSKLMNARDEETGEQMSDKQLRDEAMTIIGAGYETITQALSWTWYLLAKHPEVERRLRAELDRVLNGRAPVFADLAELKYTAMVFQEAMRLYPPVWAFSRTAINDDELGGYHIPAGSDVFLLPYITHRHPEFWDDPERFDPERFTPERIAARPRFAYFPFGGGARICIGNNFAMMEAQLIIATVMQRYSLHLVPDHKVEPEASVTLRPRHGILMTLQTR